MIIRIVKMTFRHEEITNFMNVFNEVKDSIRNFEGCSDLALWNDVFHRNILFTYSVWETEDHLNRYRQSELFNSTWARTKPKFSGKPEAWSVEQLVGSINNKSM